MKSNFVDTKCKKVILKDVLQDNGYIRGPFGSSLKRSDMLSEGIPVYEQQHAIYGNRNFRFYINDEKFNQMKRFAVKHGDLIISCSGTVGKVSKIRKNDPIGIISQALLLLRVDETKINVDYLRYFLSSREGYNSIISRSHGSVQVNIAKRKIIEEIPLNLPTLEQQNKIASILSALDNKIDVNQKINENLEQQAQAIFKSWFVDFEPFKDGEFVNSELGQIPKGWKVDTLGSIINISSGKRPLSKINEKTEDYNIPVIGASGVMAYTNNVLTDEKIIVTGRVGTHGVVQKYYKPVWVSDNAFIIKSQYYEFVYQNFKNIDYSSLNRGSTQPLITQTDLKNTLIVIPPEKYLNEFENLISSYFVRSQKLNNENQVLIQIRDTLLPKLMNGEIDVSDIKI